MKNLTYIRKAILGSIFGALVLVGTALTASAQNNSNEYRDWQRAQMEAQQRHNDYIRTRSQNDYRQWQRAEQKARERQMAYQSWNTRNNNGNRYGWNSSNNGNSYRIYRNGSYYNTDRRGAELLQQAVRNGYSQGYQQGQQARRGNRAYNYNNNSYYSSGTYGYQSYVDRNQYQYYFQQGFQRGFEDGYYSRNQYGTRSGNSFNILGSVLNTIINLANNN
jgi:hypothetical protein